MGLARLKHPKSLVPLMQTVFDPHPQVALQAIKALEELGDPRAIDVLRRVAAANIPEVSSAASRVARALQEIAQAKGLPVPPKRRPAQKPSQPTAASTK
jgi:HEAT repeat protein